MLARSSERGGDWIGKEREREGIVPTPPANIDVVVLGRTSELAGARKGEK